MSYAAGLRSINERSQDLRRASTITVKWQAANPEDRLRSATMADGRQVGSRSKWTAVPMAGTSAEAAKRPAHGQARRLYCNPTAADLLDQERPYARRQLR